MTITNPWGLRFSAGRKGGTDFQDLVRRQDDAVLALGTRVPNPFIPAAARARPRAPHHRHELVAFARARLRSRRHRRKHHRRPRRSVPRHLRPDRQRRRHPDRPAPNGTRPHGPGCVVPGRTSPEVPVLRDPNPWESTCNSSQRRLRSASSPTRKTSPQPSRSSSATRHGSLPAPCWT